VKTIASGDALVLEGVTRTFGALRAVDGVSLTVAAGERRAIIGANGAGKTTLFNVVTGDYPATAGRVRFFGEDITVWPPHERIRQGLRRTYQSSLLCRELSVEDNLFLAVRGVARGRFSLLRTRAAHPTHAATQDLLERVRLTSVAGQPVATLSHGQQRQLEIGMALAGAPRMGFILIEHDLEIALRVVERVTVLHEGRVLKEGTPAEIEGDAEVQAIYMGGR